MTDQPDLPPELLERVAEVIDPEGWHREDARRIARAVAPMLIAHGRELENAEVVAFISRFHFWQGSNDCSDARTKEWLADAIKRNEHRSTQ